MDPVPPTVAQWRTQANNFVVEFPVLLADEILAIVWTESWGRVSAFNPKDPSWGLMGVTPLIAAHYGGFRAADTSWHTDPQKNMKCGCAFLADIKTRHQAAFPAYAWVAMYNAGEPAVIGGFKDETYVAFFLNHLQSLSAG